MKRGLSVLLIVVIFTSSFFSDRRVAYASSQKNLDISEGVDGYFFTNNNAERNICISVTYDGMIDFNVVYLKEKDIVQQVKLNLVNYPEIDMDFTSEKFWNSIIYIALSNIESARKINSSETFNVETKVKSKLQTRSTSASDQLIDELAVAYGSPYEGRQMARTMKYSPIKTTLTQYMDFYVDYVNTLTWVDAVTIAAFVASLGYSSKIATAISIALGAASVGTVFTRGTTVDRYACTVLYTRCGCIEDVPYTYATMTVNHYGFEKDGITSLCNENVRLYAPNQVYYQNTTKIMDDAYTAYINN